MGLRGLWAAVILGVCCRHRPLVGSPRQIAVVAVEPHPSAITCPKHNMEPSPLGPLGAGTDIRGLGLGVAKVQWKSDCGLKQGTLDLGDTCDQLAADCILSNIDSEQHNLTLNKNVWAV